MVHFVDDAAHRPGKAVSPGVQPGRQDDELADATVGGIKEELIEEPGAAGHPRGHSLRIELGIPLDGDLPIHQPRVDVHTNGTHQRRRIWIIDQRISRVGSQRALGGDHGSRRPDTRREIPAITIGAYHRCPLKQNGYAINVDSLATTVVSTANYRCK